MNLYVHFPFCRSKCAYCALFSRAGADACVRESYSVRIAREIDALDIAPGEAHTIYFGGGSPMLCPLEPVLNAIRDKGLLSSDSECTVELHPLDVGSEELGRLRALGVNRVSLGVQTFDDATLSFLRRRHTAADARAAISSLCGIFPSVGMDLIVGLPSPPVLEAIEEVLPSLSHVSVYTLIREPKTRLDLDIRKGRTSVPDDAATLAEFESVRAILASNGFHRYEIANFARPGFECRHNFAVWRGEDYTGLGDGACGRNGLSRTTGENGAYKTETISRESDALERALFSLRTSDGISLPRIAEQWPILAPLIPKWGQTLDFNVEQGLLSRSGCAYRLTRRGAEVCDSMLADLMP